MADQPFSRRHGYEADEAEITIREDAPDGLRFALLALARRGGLTNGQLVGLLTDVLLVAPRGNWSDNYLDQELNQLIFGAEWAPVYDVAEAIYLRLQRRHELEWTDPPAHEWFEGELNAFFRREGVGWQMIEGHIEFRGPADLEEDMGRAVEMLEETERDTAARELYEARQDLSRRPTPDITGAIQHALASLECLSRDITGQPNATFGSLLRRHPNLFPRPLDHAMKQLWGYASEFARHIREGRNPDLAEAMFVVGLAASATAFLLERERQDRLS